MSPTREAILDHVRDLLKELAGDWDYSDHISAETLLFRQLGFESLDVVVLGTTIQEHYRRQMPFSDLFAEVGQRGTQDLSVGELVDFVAKYINEDETASPPAARA